MPTTRAAIQATMGSTTYWIASMTAQELAGAVRVAMETDTWVKDDPTQRRQRELKPNRIQKELAPYLQNHPHRFWGSIIVLVEPGSAVFEPLEEFSDLFEAYKKSAEKLGFLTLNDDKPIALDGQHRIAAIQMVIHGKRNKLELEPGRFTRDVPGDEMCVLIVEHETDEKTRTIFNKVNRHAKPTSRSDNIIMDEDDGNAIVARFLLDTERESPLAARFDNGKSAIVNWETNTLGQNSKSLTTLSAVYDTVCDILEDAGGFEDFPVKGKDSDPVRPDDDRLEEAYEIVLKWWEAIMRIDVFAEAVSRGLEGIAGQDGDRANRHHQQALLLKPVGLMAVVQGMVFARRRSIESGIELSVQEAVRRVNQLDFSYPSSENMWRGTVIKEDGGMVSRKEKKKLAAELVAYLIGADYMSREEKDHLADDWNRARGKDLKIDIATISEDDEESLNLVPEDLPSPLSV